MASTIFLPKSFLASCLLVLRSLSLFGQHRTNPKLQKDYPRPKPVHDKLLEHIQKYQDKILVLDLEGALFRSNLTFPYFMVIALEAGSFLRGIILLCIYPFICLLNQDMAIRVLTIISFCGLKEEKVTRVGRVVLPKHLLEDVGMEGLEMIRSKIQPCSIICVTRMPRVMVETFIREYIKGMEVVVGKEVKTVGRYYTGLVMEERRLERKLGLHFGEYVGLGCSGMRSQHQLFSFCKDFYFVDDGEKRKWHALQRDKYLKPLVFHDGRLAIRPTPFAAQAMYMWLPLGILLSLIRSLVSVYLPYNISIFVGAFFGMKTRVSFEALVNQCNNADAKCGDNSGRLEDFDFTSEFFTFLQQLQTMSPPPLASSVRKNIIRIRIKKAGAVLRSTKEELHPNSSPDMKPHKCTCCSSQVARVTPAECPTRILELMTAYPLAGRPMHSPLKRRISDLLPLSNQMGKLAHKRTSEGILESGRNQKRRKLVYNSVREKGTDSDGSSGSHQILTSTGSSCVPKAKGKIGDSTDVPKANESEESFLLLNEARNLKHRADRLKREGERTLSMILYFGAVLKFLRVASLWEHGQGENDEAAMRLYSDTAKLCQYCAAECENTNNMPAAALAYKAMELAHMKAAALVYTSSSLFNVPASANEAACLGDSMASAFKATRRYQILMHSEELSAPIITCLNFHSNNINMFIQMAHSALESIF
ncbi:glycerol-3-phosphate acyltransferase 3 [Carex littledalei]|uniref:Glycerol-3-phosphate acyltransferase 3 n=1 Tax=Carex littledalei TaxID=544730 RepID=A0A833RJK6_9POAL|nr:glycerol-3-phosphate acyltransferase 3 [Carex littledalei]